MNKIYFYIILFSFFGINSLVAQTVEGDDKNKVTLGGALRFNTLYENYEKGSNEAKMKLDAFLLKADARHDNFDLSVQYRFYPDSKVHFLHHGYIGYTIDSKWNVKLGVLQKPFGIGDFASHSWWFQLPYYMGLEDTYNTGLSTSYNHKKWKVDFAYFLGAAPKGYASADVVDNNVGNSRYSYAVVPTTGIIDGQTIDTSVRERDQFNLRLRYQLSKSLEIGVSTQLGSIYNDEIKKRKWGLSNAVHILANYNNWSLKSEVINYNYNAVANNSEALDAIQMAAYGASYDVASKGTIYVAGVGYKIDINRKLIKSIQPYIDYSFLKKSEKSYNSTHHLVPGFLIDSRAVYTYVDVAIGKNQPWLTSNFGEGLAAGSSTARWNSRININIGYYFSLH